MSAGGDGEAAGGPEARRAGDAGIFGVAGCAEFDHGAGFPIRQAQDRAPSTGSRRGRRGRRGVVRLGPPKTAGRLTMNGGGTGQRGRKARGRCGLGCVQSMRAMCSVLRRMCSVFGLMCSLSGRMCSFLRAMCSVFGGTRPPHDPPSTSSGQASSTSSGQVLRGRQDDGDVSTRSGQCVQFWA